MGKKASRISPHNDCPMPAQRCCRRVTAALMALLAPPQPLARISKPVLNRQGITASPADLTPWQTASSQDEKEVNMRALIPLLIGGALLGSFVSSNAEELGWQEVDAALGRKPTVSGDVHRYGFPRSDLSVTLDGFTLKPALALGGWVAFKPTGGKTMTVGDLVLLDSEVSPVVAKLLEGGLEITAIHNHLLRTSPPVFYVHIAGNGDAAKLAAAIHDALGASKTPLAASTAASVAAIELDTAQLDEILGAKGQVNSGVYQFGVPRREPITEDGTELSPPGPMGVATAINFQPTGGGQAAVTGDFVLTASEVNPVIQELRSNGVEVTAVHSHALIEQPRLFFLHFWATGDALKLAQVLHAALDKTVRGGTAWARTREHDRLKLKGPCSRTLSVGSQSGSGWKEPRLT